MACARRSLLATLATPCIAAAASDPALDVQGAIAPPSPRRLDLAALDALASVALSTRTPWTQGPQHFSGVPMRRLLASLEAQGTMLRAVALNDYAVEMPVEEVLASDGFLATRQDDAPIPVRLRGPFWIVFPWSQRPELDTADHRQRSVWQLHRIEIGSGRTPWP